MAHRALPLALGCLSLVGCAEADDVRTAEQAVVVCADGDTVEGIDVSYYQDTIDWDAVKGAGIGFGITRVNHGGFFDPKFYENWDAMKARGMIRGAYQFFNPDDDVAAQAQTLIDAVGVLGPGDLPAVLDVEVTNGVGPATISSRVQQWVDLVEAATGKPPIIYTGSYFWNDNVGTTAVNDHPLWIAHYTSGCPNLPTAWSDWAFHQYTSTGSVPGIAGNVDRNRWNGSYADLEAFAAGPVTQADWAAEFVSLTAPKQLELGATGTVTIVLKNVGLATWDGSTRLGTTEPRDHASPLAAPSWIGPDRPAAVVGTVPPGETYAFEFEVVAPLEVGTVLEHVGVVQEAVAWFSDDGQGGPADDLLWFQIEVVPDDPGQGGQGGAGGGNSIGGQGNAPPPGAAFKCSCELAGSDAGGRGWLAAAALGLALARRRRR